MSEERPNSGHPDPAALGRLAGEGPGPAAESVREHVRGCMRCRREVEGIRRVLRAAGTLPEGIPPGRDLWPEVEARVRADEESRVRGGEGDGLRLREAAPWLVAAAAVLVAATGGATLWLSGGIGTGEMADAERPTAEAAAGGATALPASLRGVRSAYLPMVDRLGELVERRRDRLPPETRRVIERNLEIIDAAIAEAEAALGARPSSPGLIRALDRTYEKKLDLLRRSARLTARL